MKRYDELWQAIFRKVPDRKKIQNMSWQELAKIARELGYEDYAKAWENSGA